MTTTTTTVDSKVCTRCRVPKPFGEFSPGNGKNGLNSYCKQCRVVYARELHERHRAALDTLFETLLGELKQLHSQPVGYCWRCDGTIEPERAQRARFCTPCAQRIAESLIEPAHVNRPNGVGRGDMQ